MELKDLVGEHLLDAVDFSNEKVKEEYGSGFEDCQVMRFRLDGNVYTVIEDPSDGYRSAMREIAKTNDKMNNTFPAVRVVCVHREHHDRSAADVLQLICVASGKIVVEVGTGNTDDYYPYFVAEFHPEAITPLSERFT